MLNRKRNWDTQDCVPLLRFGRNRAPFLRAGLLGYWHAVDQRGSLAHDVLRPGLRLHEKS